MSLKSPGFALAVGLLLSSFGLVTTARADLVVAGSTTGEFFNTSNVSLGTSTGPNDLSFSGASFGPSPLIPDQVLDLGSFTLHNGQSSYDNYKFALTLTFTAPPNASGNPVTGTLMGFVQGNGGSVNIDFPISSHFTYDGGSFDLSVTDFFLEKTQGGDDVSGILEGRITNVTLGDVTSSVPEPRPYDFLITAIGGIVFLLYRRRYGHC